SRSFEPSLSDHLRKHVTLMSMILKKSDCLCEPDGDISNGKVLGYAPGTNAGAAFTQYFHQLLNMEQNERAQVLDQMNQDEKINDPLAELIRRKILRK